MRYENYIGIPFQANGRSRDGLDCWGLVRLIYEEQYQIDLPSFTSDYDIEDDDRIKELISQYQEGWEETDIPKEGSVVLFKILGELTHIGIMISNKHFIHVREGSNTVIDNIEGFRWKNRVVGFYDYKPNKTPIVLNAVPHPLKTQRITRTIKEGTNLEEIHQLLLEEHPNSSELVKSANILVNGKVIPRPLWSITTVKEADTIEYRALAGKDVLRIAAFVAIAVFAQPLAVALGPSLGLAVGTIGNLTFAGYALSAAIMVAGSLLINAIAPIRPPSTEDPGSPEQQNLIGGASNTFNPYGPIPVVLGKMRLTPPVGAKGFATYPEPRTSYLNMLLIWGYGPLSLSEFRVGQVPWNEYQFNTSPPLTPYTDTSTDSITGRITFDRKNEVITGVPISEAAQKAFDEIYGVDVDQQQSGVELVGPEYIPGNTTPTVGNIVGVTMFNQVTLQFDEVTGLAINPPGSTIVDLNDNWIEQS